MKLINFIRKYFIFIKRIKELTSNGYWYINMAGGLTDSHCMRIISRKELFNMTNEEYKEFKK